MSASLHPSISLLNRFCVAALSDVAKDQLIASALGRPRERAISLSLVSSFDTSSMTVSAVPSGSSLTDITQGIQAFFAAK